MMKDKANRRTVRRMLSVFLAVLMLLPVTLLGGAFAAGNTSGLTDATVKSYETQIDQLKEEQKAIQAKLNKLKRESASMQEYKAELDTYLEATMRRMEASSKLLDELSLKIDAKKQEITDNTTEYEKMYGKFLDMMVLSHEEGDASYIGLILGADNLSDFLSRLERVTSMLDYNKSVMDRLKTVGGQLETDRLALEEAIAIQEQTLKELEAEQADYQTRCDEVIRQMEALSKDQAAAQRELAKNQAKENELDKQLEAYLIELQKKNQAKMEAGSWHWPIPLSADQYCSSVYGWRILYGVWDYHRGWDIACWLGTDIEAAKGGTVVIAQYHSSYGNYIVIDHGDGVIGHYYGLAETLNVKAGQEVSMGEIIGQVGETAEIECKLDPHLHFGITKNGAWIDPIKFIEE